MDKITTATLDLVVADLMVAAREIAKKHGLDYKGVNSRYDSLGFSSSLKFALPLSAPAAQDANKMNAMMLGLPEDILGKVIRYGKDTMRIVGFNLNKPKFGVMAEVVNQNNKSVNIVTDSVKRIVQDPKNFVGAMAVPSGIGKTGTPSPDMVKPKPEGKLFLRPNPIQRAEAEKAGIDFNDPQNLIIMTGAMEGEAKFSLHRLNKPIAEYNNGMLKMQIASIMKKHPFGTAIVNDNIPTSLL